MNLQGKVIYGNWRDGSDIYKDRNGYYVIQWNRLAESSYKKYLTRWKPSPENKRVYFNTITKRWQLDKPKKNKNQ